MKNRLLLPFFAMLLLTMTGITSACGGFFCTNTPIDQNAERIIFTVNGDGTITAIVGIGYEGAAEDFSWVVPVPSPPELDVAETTMLDNLQQFTTPAFIEPEEFPCQGIFADSPGMGGGGGLFIEKGNVGPYDYAVVGGQDVTELVTWLRDNNYRVEPEMEPIIAQYVDEGMLFLAMKLSQEAEVGDIQPIVMTYQSEKPMIPIRLTAIAATPDMPVLVWIFADMQYVPENYAHVEPDFSQMAGPRRIEAMSIDVQPFDWFFWQGQPEYQMLLDGIQEEYDGRAFVTQFAQPVTRFFDDVYYRPQNFVPSAMIESDPMLTDLIARFPYVTRLRAQLSPEQMTIDPVFVPAPEQADVAHIVELEGKVNPLAFYGCSTRTAIGDETRALLPEGFMYLPDEGVALRYPEGWVMSEFMMQMPYVADDDPDRMLVFAPEPVTEATFRAFFEGEATPPMFFMMPDTVITAWGRTSALQLLYRDVLQWDNERFTSDDMRAIAAPYFVRIRANPKYERFGGPIMGGGAFFGVLADDETWAAQGDMFTAMLDYVGSFDYYLDDELRHTLMLAPDAYNFNHSRLFVPYPDGWTERMDGSTIELLAEDGTSVVRIKPLKDFADCDIEDECTSTFAIGGQQPLYNENMSLWVRAVDWIRVTYDLDFELRGEDRQALLACYPVPGPAPAFSTEARQGFVRLYPRHVIEFSAPLEEYEDTYRAIFERMLGQIEATSAECNQG